MKKCWKKKKKKPNHSSHHSVYPPKTATKIHRCRTTDSTLPSDNVGLSEEWLSPPQIHSPPSLIRNVTLALLAIPTKPFPRNKTTIFLSNRAPSHSLSLSHTLLFLSRFRLWSFWVSGPFRFYPRFCCAMVGMLLNFGCEGFVFWSEFTRCSRSFCVSWVKMVWWNCSSLISDCVLLSFSLLLIVWGNGVH